MIEHTLYLVTLEEAGPHVPLLEHWNMRHVRELAVLPRQVEDMTTLKGDNSDPGDCPDPEIMGGTPVFVGTRVPLTTLLDYLEAGQPLSEFLEDFPTVTREQSVAAL